jgi:hypothetical protein
VLENTYTYTARSADHPEQVVTFTLHNHSLSVGVGAPLEHVERALQARGGETGAEAETETGSEYRIQPWLKPMAISLIERSTGPFDVGDVNASAEDDWLWVRAWLRAGGLRLAPITLIKGRVDNPHAAHAFVQELHERKAPAAGLARFPGLLDYWATWILAGFLMVILFENWRRRRGNG